MISLTPYYILLYSSVNWYTVDYSSDGITVMTSLYSGYA